MKKLIVLIIGFTCCTTVLFGNNKKPIESAKKQLNVEIVKLLGHHQFPLTTAEAQAEIYLLLNAKNELVVISVKSENPSLENYIKRKLNYKKIRVHALQKMKIYKMPIKIIQS